MVLCNRQACFAGYHWIETVGRVFLVGTRSEKSQYLHEKYQGIPPHCDHATKCEDGSRKGEFCYQNFEISMREEVRCDVVELNRIFCDPNIDLYCSLWKKWCNGFVSYLVNVATL